MPLTDCPFTLWADGIYRPTLQIRIINPHSGLSQRGYGIIDTGADECAVPASYANLLGHDLQAGRQKTVSTGNGETIAYAHTTKFEIFSPSTGQVVHTINDAPIDFMPNLHVILLGVHSFLSDFILRIDYPHKIFSIKYPQ
jgi:hypothetical protein